MTFRGPFQSKPSYDSTTAQTQLLQSGALRYLHPHQSLTDKNQLFQIHFSDVYEDSSAPEGGLGTQQIATSAPHAGVTLQLSESSAGFRPAGSNTDVCPQS